MITTASFHGCFKPAGVTSPDFDPTTIPQCTLWLAASNMTGFADGDAVGAAAPDAWANLGSVGGTYTIGVVNQRGTYRAAVVNTRPVVRFVSTGAALADQDRLASATSLTNWIDASDYTFFAVVRPTIGGGTDGTARYYRRPPIWQEINGHFHVGIYNQCFSLNHNQNSGEKLLSAAYTLDTWYVVECWFGGGTMNIKVNGGTAVSGASANIGTLSGSVAVAGSNGVDACFDGDIAEIIMYDADIGSTDRGTVRAAMGAKYAITV